MEFNTEKLTYTDLQKLSEQDYFYSLAISPFTLGIASLIVFTFLLGFGPGAPAAAFSVVCIVVTIHNVLGWQDYASNWKYYYRISLAGNTYYVVKDGARRVRVIHDEGTMLRDIKSNQVHLSDSSLKKWLKTDKPILGTLDESSGSIPI